MLESGVKRWKMSLATSFMLTFPLRYFTKHQRIIFNGNGYSEEWQKEAAKRGLLNLRTTPDILEVVHNEKNVKFFNDLNVLCPEEFNTHVEVAFDNYSKRIVLEAFCLANMSNQKIIPAAISYLNELKLAGQNDRANKISKLVDSGFKNTDALADAAEKLEHHIESDVKKAARFSVDTVIPAMLATRDILDNLEKLVPSKNWPMPSYQDILFKQHV